MILFSSRQTSLHLLLVTLSLSSTSSFADWKVIYQEDFESSDVIDAKQWQTGQWQRDSFPDYDKFSEQGSYFLEKNIQAPEAYRLSTSFGQQSLSYSGWLTAESYTRDKTTDPTKLLSIQTDPIDKKNRVLKLSSPKHTDATLIRSSESLQGRYRISLKIGYPNFGNGVNLNGYDGDERAGPWLQQSAINENGFYWLAITDTVPRPHNNIWLHHHRKVVIDSDNHYPAWSQIWNGSEFIDSGKHPIMIFALDGNGKTDELTGKPFLSYSQNKWWPSGEIKAVDAYLPEEWYQLVIERNKNIISIQLSGEFEYGGDKTYTTEIDLNQQCVWHFNRAFDNKNDDCAKDESSDYKVWSDYFFFGDPHINFYEGDVLYDDIKFEMWREE